MRGEERVGWEGNKMQGECCPAPRPTRPPCAQSNETRVYLSLQIRVRSRGDISRTETGSNDSRRNPFSFLTLKATLRSVVFSMLIRVTYRPFESARKAIISAGEMMRELSMFPHALSRVRTSRELALLRMPVFLQKDQYSKFSL
jgi:hypothetical protein